MASGRPILASDLPSIREILTEETGYFADADDPSSFADALKRIIADPNGAERKASAARRFAEENTWSKRAQRIFLSIEATDLRGV
jgi:glycosyltransferase involved in cell wall biosynthesis